MIKKVSKQLNVTSWNYF